MRDFSRHIFSAGRSPNVSKFLDISRDGVLRPFAARYVLRTDGAAVPPAPIADMFVPIVHMSPRAACNAFLDGKHLRRPATATGTVSIRDRRVTSYADSPTIDNVSFYISFESLTRIIEQAGGRKVDAFPHLLDRAQTDPVLHGLALTTAAIMDHAPEASPLLLDHMYQALCCHVASTYGGLIWPTRAHRGGLSAWQETRIKDLLLSDLRGGVSLAQLAALCDMSERHFSRAFNQSIGAPPHRWLLQKRVERAQSLLKRTNVAISWIALECGFASQSHLNRVFTKVVGESPGAWRRAHRE